MPATGTFRMTSMNEETYAELKGGGKLTRASAVQEFSGDLEAIGEAELVMCYAADGTAVITGLQRFRGRLGDRTGSFVASYRGTYDGTEAKATLTVVPESGRGDLAGLTGEGVAVAGHEPPGSYTFDLA